MSRLSNLFTQWSLHILIPLWTLQLALSLSTLAVTARWAVQSTDDSWLKVRGSIALTLPCFAICFTLHEIIRITVASLMGLSWFTTYVILSTKFLQAVIWTTLFALMEPVTKEPRLRRNSPVFRAANPTIFELSVAAAVISYIALLYACAVVYMLRRHSKAQAKASATDGTAETAERGAMLPPPRRHERKRRPAEMDAEEQRLNELDGETAVEADGGMINEMEAPLKAAHRERYS